MLITSYSKFSLKIHNFFRYDFFDFYIIRLSKNNIYTMIKRISVTLLVAFATQYLSAAEIYINSNSGSSIAADDGFCTLHEAIIAANTNTASGITPGECIAGETIPSIDILKFDSSILPTSIALEIPFTLTESATIEGPHRDLLTLATIGTDRIGIISNTVPSEFTIRGVTFYGGLANISTPPDSTGGALLVSLSTSTLLIERVKFINNSAQYAGGAISIAYGANSDNLTTITQSEFHSNSVIGSTVQANDNTGGGGAIFIGGFQNVEIIDSTFYQNSAHNTATPPQSSGDSMGGAIWMLSSSVSAVSNLTIDSSTFENNDSYGAGGAIAVGGPGFPTDVSAVNIKHTTITNNQADSNNSDTGSAGGGIYSSSDTPVNILNNVIATNTDNSQTNPRHNIAGTFSTLGHNFMNGNSGYLSEFPVGMPNANNDLIGTPLATPDLGILGNEGGPTLSRKPENGSPLIDQGKCGNKLSDQRGYQNQDGTSRIVDSAESNLADGCDIGAVEYEGYIGNMTPDAVADNYPLLEGQSISFTSPFNVLSNDTDFENDPLVVLNAGQVSINTTTLTPGFVDLRVDGNFEFIPEQDDFGSATFDYTISDGVSFNDAATVTLNILPVNDAPMFDSGSTFFGFSGNNQSSGLHEYQNWATNISPGPLNESTQNFQFIIQISGDTSIFATPPTVSNSGTLSLDIAENSVGVAFISIILKDNGGTLNGGVDESEEVVVTVNANLDLIFSSSFEDLGGS